jgi:hypothetical protein
MFLRSKFTGQVVEAELEKDDNVGSPTRDHWILLAIVPEDPDRNRVALHSEDAALYELVSATDEERSRLASSAYDIQRSSAVRSLWFGNGKPGPIVPTPEGPARDRGSADDASMF